MKRSLILGLALLTMIVLLMATNRTQSASRKFSISDRANGTKPPPAPRPLEEHIGAQGEPIEGELITIHPHGFEPKEINRQAGRFLIAVDNRSGLEEDIALTLDRVGGSRLRQIEVARNKLDWRDLVDLPPGRYILREVNHPDWACQIVIDTR